MHLFDVFARNPGRIGLLAMRGFSTVSRETMGAQRADQPGFIGALVALAPWPRSAMHSSLMFTQAYLSSRLERTERTLQRFCRKLSAFTGFTSWQQKEGVFDNTVTSESLFNRGFAFALAKITKILILVTEIPCSRYIKIFFVWFTSLLIFHTLLLAIRRCATLVATLYVRVKAHLVRGEKRADRACKSALCMPHHDMCENLQMI